MYAKPLRRPAVRTAVFVLATMTGLLTTGCSSSKSPASETPATEAPAAEAATETLPTAGEPTATGAGATTSGRGKLIALQSGDAACYIELETSGNSVSLPGSFELCVGGSADATALVGATVEYTTERGKILAPTCQGSPDCPDSEEVDLVTTLTAAAAAPTPASSPGTTEQTTFGIDGLPLGLSADDLVRQIGVQPTSKSKPVLEAATGEYATTWTFDGRGVSAKLSAIAEDLAPNLRALTITKPSALKTNQGIGLGATKEDVMAAYGPSVNTEESDAQNIVIGSVFDGIIFSLAENLVIEIFVGAAAE